MGTARLVEGGRREEILSLSLQKRGSQPVPKETTHGNVSRLGRFAFPRPTDATRDPSFSLSCLAVCDLGPHPLAPRDA